MSSQQKKRQRKKDPNAPKRPSSSFLFFGKSERSNLRETHPDLPLSKIACLLGEQWRALSPEKRGPFEALAREDKGRYATEKADYVPDETLQLKTKRKRKDPLAPKRARSAYIWFANATRGDVMAEYPGLSVPALGRELGRRWSELKSNATELAPFIQQALEDKTRAADELAAYKTRTRLV